LPNNRVPVLSNNRLPVMRVLITGGSGQLGTDLVRVFGDAGDHAVGYSHADLDVADRENVLQVVGAFRPDAVIHAGAWTNVDGCETEPERAYAANAMGSRHVAEAAALVQARVVYVSTDYVFDGRGTGPNGGGAYTEWDATGPISHYGRSKLGGEAEVQSLLGPAATVVRTSWVCGPHGNNFVKTMLRLAREGADAAKTITVVDDQRGCPTFTGDLAVALRRLAVSRLPGVFHVSNAGPVTWCDFAKAIFAVSGHDADRVVPIPTSELHPVRPAQRPAVSVLDNAAWRAVGLAPLRPWQEALEESMRVLGD
jgi:dTDP-4-dehydrorhamnose reductase